LKRIIFNERFPLAYNSFSPIKQLVPETTMESVTHRSKIANTALQLHNCLLSEPSHQFAYHLINLLSELIKKGEIYLSKYLARIEVAQAPIKAHFSRGNQPLPANLIVW